jgi:hypothetical protein
MSDAPADVRLLVMADVDCLRAEPDQVDDLEDAERVEDEERDEPPLLPPAAEYQSAKPLRTMVQRSARPMSGTRIPAANGE